VLVEAGCCATCWQTRAGPRIIRALSRLDSSLIDSLQNLNKQDRALLLAIVEQLGEKKP
jgi:hypothetical protein